jgi:hypothetical protein
MSCEVYAMIRLLGILVGAAVAVAVLILLVGLPEFPDRSGQDAPPTVTEESGQDAPPTVTEESGQDAPPTVTEESGQDAPPTVTEESGQDAPPTVTEESAQNAPPTVPVESAQEAPPTTTPDPDHWYAFWSPFRSELAANGFVTQLQRTTGLDYRVVKLKPGIYEVAFAYSDDADIETKLAQISAATGLDIPES